MSNTSSHEQVPKYELPKEYVASAPDHLKAVVPKISQAHTGYRAGDVANASGIDFAGEIERRADDAHAKQERRDSLRGKAKTVATDLALAGLVMLPVGAVAHLEGWTNGGAAQPHNDKDKTDLTVHLSSDTMPQDIESGVSTSPQPQEHPYDVPNLDAHQTPKG